MTCVAMADTGLDPTTIERTGHANDYLICPPDRCEAEPDQASPDFAVPASDLLTAWQDVIVAAPRTTIIKQDDDAGTIHAEQLSRLLGFVDTVLIRIFETDGGSTFAAYSRSETGLYDFGVNRRRLEDWSGQLMQLLSHRN